MLKQRVFGIKNYFEFGDSFYWKEMLGQIMVNVLSQDHKWKIYSHCGRSQDNVEVGSVSVHKICQVGISIKKKLKIYKGFWH